MHFESHRSRVLLRDEHVQTSGNLRRNEKLANIQVQVSTGLTTNEKTGYNGFTSGPWQSVHFEGACL